MNINEVMEVFTNVTKRYPTAISSANVNIINGNPVIEMTVNRGESFVTVNGDTATYTTKFGDVINFDRSENCKSLPGRIKSWLIDSAKTRSNFGAVVRELFLRICCLSDVTYISSYVKKNTATLRLKFKDDIIDIMISIKDSIYSVNVSNHNDELFSDQYTIEEFMIDFIVESFAYDVIDADEDEIDYVVNISIEEVSLRAIEHIINNVYGKYYSAKLKVERNLFTFTIYNVDWFENGITFLILRDDSYTIGLTVFDLARRGVYCIRANDYVDLVDHVINAINKWMNHKIDDLSRYLVTEEV